MYKTILINTDSKAISDILYNRISKDYYGKIEDVKYLKSNVYTDKEFYRPFIDSMMIMSKFIDVYDKYTTDENMIRSNTKVFVMITNVYSGMSGMYKDTKEFNRDISHFYKCFKMAGCRRPDKFIYCTDSSKKDEVDSRAYIIAHNLNESQDGDSLILGTNDYDQIKTLIDTYAGFIEDDSEKCTFCKVGD